MLSFLEFFLGSCSESCVLLLLFLLRGQMVRLVFHVLHGFAFLGSQPGSGVPGRAVSTLLTNEGPAAFPGDFPSGPQEGPRCP